MIEILFGSLLNNARLSKLTHFYESSNFSTRSFLDFCQIKCISPGNVAKTGFNKQSIDFHTSYAVFEHIPIHVLKAILEEGNRIITDDGLFIHRIDYSDHFSHSDTNISAINFLQFSDTEWDKYAGNTFMYTNRLRHDDYLNLFQSSGHRILLDETYKNQRSLELLISDKLQLSERFKPKTAEMLSISGSWIVSQKIDY